MILVEHCSVCGGRTQSVISIPAYPLITSACRRGQPIPELPIEIGVCDTCSHVQLRQRPTQQHLDAIYLSDYTSVVPHGVFPAADRLTVECKTFFDFAVPELPEGSRVLEIGCFDGSFLGLFGARYELLGSEPNAMGAVAAEHFGVKVVPKYFDPADFSASPIQLVIMRHLIEHVPEPLELIEQCRAVLAPGGLILVETPRIEYTFANHVIGNLYLQHLHYFSEVSLRRLFQRAGMDVVAHGTKDFRQFLVARMPAASAPAFPSAAEPHAAKVRELALSYQRHLGVLRDDLGRWLSSHDGKIVVYGASSTATGLIHLLSLPLDRIAFVVDGDPRKAGMVMPGTELEVFGPERLDAVDGVAVLIASDYFRADILATIRARYADHVATCFWVHPKLEVVDLKAPV